MKILDRINPTYRLHKLPRLKSRSFVHEGKRYYTGSIVKRWINGPIKIYWHYAFVYGVDTKGRILLIEHNQDGVECVTWEDFIIDKKDFEIHHTERSSKRFDMIIKRAKKKAKTEYHAVENNCEHFVNFCLFDKNESMQTDRTKEIADAFFSLFEMKLLNTPDSEMVLKSVDSFRKSLNVPRVSIPNFSDKLDNMIKEKLKNYKN